MSDGQKGRKALLLNVTKQSFRESLINSRLSQNSQTKGESESINIEIISEKWKSAFDMVIIAESIGIAIVTFRSEQDDESEETCLINEETKLQMAAAILPLNRKAVIHSIQIYLGTEDSKVIPVGKSPDKNGVRIKAYIDPVKSNVGALVKEVFGKIHNNTEMEDLRVFLARLYVLQYMMSMEKVLHETLDSQEWGQKGICIWTKEQKDIIDEITTDLQEGKDVKRVISGGPGSGKTLMLQEIATRFMPTK